MDCVNDPTRSARSTCMASAVLTRWWPTSIKVDGHFQRLVLRCCLKGVAGCGCLGTGKICYGLVHRLGDGLLGSRWDIRWMTTEPMSNSPDSTRRRRRGVVVAFTSDMWTSKPSTLPFLHLYVKTFTFLPFFIPQLTRKSTI